MNNCKQQNKNIRIFALLFFCLQTFLGNAFQGIQIIHGAYGRAIDTLDFYLNDVRVADDYIAPAATPFLPVVAGNADYTVKVRRHKDAPTVPPLKTFTVSLAAGKSAVIALLGSEESGLNFEADLDARVVASNREAVELCFIHAAATKPSLDVLERTEGMIIGNLAYGQQTSFLTFSTTEYFFDVKAHGTVDLLGTYRIFLYNDKGKAARVLFTRGSDNGVSDLGMAIVYADGSVVPLVWAPVARVQFLNAIPAVIDVYKNLTKFSDNAVYRSAMPFKYVPAGIDMNISISPQTSSGPSNAYSVTPFVFENPKSYYAIASGLLNNPAYPPAMRLIAGAREKSDQPGGVSLGAVNAILGGLPVKIRVKDAALLADKLDYMQLSAFQPLTPNPYTLEIVRADDENVRLGAFNIALGAFQDQALLVILSGDYSSGTLKDFAIWAASPNGQAITLAPLSGTDTPVQIENMQLFPNPASDRVAISLTLRVAGEVAYTVSNAAGQIVRTLMQENMDAGNSIQTIDLDGLPDGLYFLQTRSGAQTKQSFFTIQNNLK